MEKTDEYTHLREAFKQGKRIQAWHLRPAARVSSDGQWDTLKADKEPEFGCPVHLYRVHPEDV